MPTNAYYNRYRYSDQEDPFAGMDERTRRDLLLKMLQAQTRGMSPRSLITGFDEPITVYKPDEKPDEEQRLREQEEAQLLRYLMGDSGQQQQPRGGGGGRGMAPSFDMDAYNKQKLKLTKDLNAQNSKIAKLQADLREAELTQDAAKISELQTQIAAENETLRLINQEYQTNESSMMSAAQSSARRNISGSMTINRSGKPYTGPFAEAQREGGYTEPGTYTAPIGDFYTPEIEERVEYTPTPALLADELARTDPNMISAPVQGQGMPEQTPLPEMTPQLPGIPTTDFANMGSERDKGVLSALLRALIGTESLAR